MSSTRRIFSCLLPLASCLSRPRRARAFTLIEVMISIFLVLLLIVGINQAFKIVSTTVGAGQAMSSKARDSFTVQTAFTQEIGRALAHDETSPCLIIGSRTQPAFRSKLDAETDRDFDPSADAQAREQQMLTIDLDNNNVEGDTNMPGEILNRGVSSNRVYRVDILTFFARDLYRRQTGNPPTDNRTDFPPTTPITTGQGTSPVYNWARTSFAANQSSNQAFVSYGHLWLPRYDANGAPVWYLSDGQTETFPGAGSAADNPNNFYASDWALGRMAILLAEPFYTPELPLDTPLVWSGGSQNTQWKSKETGSARWWENERPPAPPLDRNSELVVAIDRPPFVAPGLTYTTRNTQPTNFLPIAKWHHPDPAQRTPPADWACSSWENNPEYQLIESGRYDVAIGSFNLYRRILTDSIRRGTQYSTDPGPGQAFTIPRYLFRWWEPLAYRFRASPKIPKPLSSAGVAQAQPIMLPNCTEFIVEFAGDFVSQEPLYVYHADTGDHGINREGGLAAGRILYGEVNGVYTDTTNPGRTDGQIDFIVDKSADKSTQKDQTDLWIRKVRWYGFPRDVTGDGKMDAYPRVELPSDTEPNPKVRNNDLQDVVPLRDVFLTYTEHYRKKLSGGAGPGPLLDLDEKQAVMDPLVERDMNPYRTATKDTRPPRDGGSYNWPNNLPQPPQPTGISPTDPPAADYRDSLIDAPDARYIAAFGPNDDALLRIKMIRITVKLDDPNNRLADGQYYQYVIALP